MKGKSRFIPSGIYSCGTLRTEDLTPTFIDILDDIVLTKEERKKVSAIKRAMVNDDYYDSEDASYDLNDDIFDILNNHCLPYSYFGSSEGDGACFGAWASIESIMEELQYHEIYTVESAPKGYRGYIVSISDHGNITLFNRQSFGHGYKDTFIWRVV